MLLLTLLSMQCPSAILIHSLIPSLLTFATGVSGFSNEREEFSQVYVTLSIFKIRKKTQSEEV
jgi:hypothetical protein